MDSHTAGIYGVLLAVVAVGVVGLYFTTMMAGEPSVIYVGGANTPPTVTAYMPPFYAKIAEISKPFTVKGQGITGLSPYRTGTASINTSQTLDLRMPKYTILCNATLDQDNDTAELYTCGDNVSIGGRIDCDYDGNGDSGTNPTNSTTCAGSPTTVSGPGTYGAFIVCNHGSTGQLNATLLNLTLGNVTNYNIYLDNILYNSIANDPTPGGYYKGCNGTCNKCGAPNTPTCFKDMNTSGTYSNSVLECDFFDTSGQCICECFSIHITNEDDIHQLKNGESLEFVIMKKIEFTSLNASTDC